MIKMNTKKLLEMYNERTNALTIDGIEDGHNMLDLLENITDENFEDFNLEDITNMLASIEKNVEKLKILAYEHECIYNILKKIREEGVPVWHFKVAVYLAQIPEEIDSIGDTGQLDIEIIEYEKENHEKHYRISKYCMDNRTFKTVSEALKGTKIYEDHRTILKVLARVENDYPVLEAIFFASLATGSIAIIGTKDTGYRFYKNERIEEKKGYELVPIETYWCKDKIDDVFRNPIFV